MDFNANQMKEDALIKEGRYKFRVLDAREKRSGAGNDMINLKLQLEVSGRAVTYWVSLILMPKMFWLIEHFCQATGMPEKIEEGRIMAQDCLNRQGYIDIIIKTNKDTGECENATKDFVKPENLEPAQQAPEFDDELPDLS